MIIFRDERALISLVVIGLGGGEVVTCYDRKMSQTPEQTRCAMLRAGTCGHCSLEITARSVSRSVSTCPSGSPDNAVCQTRTGRVEIMLMGT